MTLEEQLAYFDAHADLAFEQALQAFADDRWAVLKEARKRLIEWEPVYQDKNWLLSRRKQRKERREEIADVVNYTVMMLWRLSV